MRILVVLLVVANILFIAWVLWGPNEDPLPRATPLAASPLVLLDELPTSQAVPAAGDVPPSPDEPTGAPAGCQALGPFLDPDVARAAQGRLQAVGVVATARSVDASQRLGYWVHTPAAADRADADATIGRLQNAGIRDFYVVADGEFQNAVSLGVFSQQATAEQHAARLEALGFDVEVGERRREITAWWVDFPIPERGSPAAARVAELVLAGGDSLVLQPRACD
jgi:hypothetical protein